ncbi:MAG: transcriptional regulator [Actinobacteria bacterium]|nr:MAG: transcriptional regulator [Actinomycetota bacterium]
MAHSPEERRKILNRLKRARGQLDAVITHVENDASCEDIITQLSAVTSALHRAGFTIVSGAMRECTFSEDDDAHKIEQLEKLFLSLS